MICAPTYHVRIKYSIFSELNQIDETFFENFACSIDQAISGLPQNFIIFFFGIDLEPPRAKIITTLFFIFTIQILHLQANLHQRRDLDL